jgi:hypothetical protein
VRGTDGGRLDGLDGAVLGEVPEPVPVVVAVDDAAAHPVARAAATIRGTASSTFLMFS